MSAGIPTVLAAICSVRAGIRTVLAAIRNVSAGIWTVPVELWRNVMSRGQDAMCFKCRQLSGEEVDSNLMVCDECGRIKAKASFEDAMQDKWRTLFREAVICKTC